MIRQRAAITAASIAGVVLAGGTAVGANIGILNAADDSEMGNLSAEVPITAAAADTSTTTANTEQAASQWYTADGAGDIEVTVDGDSVGLGAVLTNQGWTWESRPSPDGSVVVRFKSADDELVFTAEQTDDGRVAAGVERIFSDGDDANDGIDPDDGVETDGVVDSSDRPTTARPATSATAAPTSSAILAPASPTTLAAAPATTTTAPAVAPTTQSSAYYDDEEYEDHDEYEDDDDEDHEDEDDDDEYEGADDDD